MKGHVLSPETQVCCEAGEWGLELLRRHGAIKAAKILVQGYCICGYALRTMRDQRKRCRHCGRLYTASGREIRHAVTPR